MACFGVIFLANMGGGGCQTRFQSMAFCSFLNFAAPPVLRVVLDRGRGSENAIVWVARLQKEIGPRNLQIRNEQWYENDTKRRRKDLSLLLCPCSHGQFKDK